MKLAATTLLLTLSACALAQRHEQELTNVLVELRDSGKINQEQYDVMLQALKEGDASSVWAWLLNAGLLVLGGLIGRTAALNTAKKNAQTAAAAQAAKAPVATQAP